MFVSSWILKAAAAMPLQNSYSLNGNTNHFWCHLEKMMNVIISKPCTWEGAHRRVSRDGRFNPWHWRTKVPSSPFTVLCLVIWTDCVVSEPSYKMTVFWRNYRKIAILGPCHDQIQKWAASWQNQQNKMCAQRRIRWAWAFAQSDQSLRCLHEESLGS